LRVLRKDVVGASPTVKGFKKIWRVILLPRSLILSQSLLITIMGHGKLRTLDLIYHTRSRCYPKYTIEEEWWG
jgi:hypothetical protein